MNIVKKTNHLVTFLVGVFLLSSCAMVSIDNNPSNVKDDVNIGKYHVTNFEVELDKKIESSENMKILEDYKKAFEARLVERNSQTDNSIKVKMKVLITKLKIKGTFARISRMLGGKDIISTNVEVISQNGKKLKSYSSKIESGVTPRELLVYRLSASAILHEIFGDEKE